MSSLVQAPVLILAFNRPERLRQLIDRLRELQIPQVFVAIDGPRDSVPSDAERVAHTRSVVAEIDWPCSVSTLFQDHNLGCGLGVSTAITWFFEEVDEGIILEDDVLPAPDFFAFCNELLERYRNDQRVFAISGCNFAPADHITHPADTHRFSAITHVWGWATWRRSWEKYEFSMRTWRKRLRGSQRWKAMGGDLGGYVYWSAVFDWMRFGHVDTWDYQLALAQMASGGLTATANVNLTENVGFSDDSTHTNYRPSYVQPAGQLRGPLSNPAVQRDIRADRWVRQQILQATTSSMGVMAKDNILQRLAEVTRPMRRLGKNERG